MGDIKIDASELTALAVSIQRIDPEIVAKLNDVVQESGKRLQQDARSRARAIGGHARGYSNKITTTFKPAARKPSVEVGPILGGMGSLGGILEFGSPTSAPHPHLHPAFDEEVPRFDRAIADLADGVVDGLL